MSRPFEHFVWFSDPVTHIDEFPSVSFTADADVDVEAVVTHAVAPNEVFILDKDHSFWQSARSERNFSAINVCCSFVEKIPKKYWHDVKIPYKLHSHNGHNMFRIGNVIARMQNNGEKPCWWQGLNLRPCAPQWQTTILAAFFRLSLCPSIVAAWYD